MLGFVIWALVGVLIIALGIKDLFAKKPAGFWANAETIKVSDIKGYNRATGLLFISYGVIFILLGIPLLGGQNNAFILLSAVGVMFETIVIMAVYTLVIVKKYSAD
jgi:hypothetical protein